MLYAGLEDSCCSDEANGSESECLEMCSVVSNADDTPPARPLDDRGGSSPLIISIGNETTAGSFLRPRRPNGLRECDRNSISMRSPWLRPRNSDGLVFGWHRGGMCQKGIDQGASDIRSHYYWHRCRSVFGFGSIWPNHQRRASKRCQADETCQRRGSVRDEHIDIRDILCLDDAVTGWYPPGVEHHELCASGIAQKHPGSPLTDLGP